MIIKTVFLALSLSSSAFLVKAAHADLSINEQIVNQSVILNVQNMTCPMCKYTIKKALLGVEGVNKVEVDYDAKTANVDFNPQKTSTDVLIKAITNAGYPATVSR